MEKMMKAAVVYGKNDVRIEEIPVPEVPEGSLVIKVDYCAICGTDLRVYRKGDFRATFPRVTGHEISGTIVEIDPAVTGFKVGDRVVVAPGHGCGKCKICREGHPNVCLDPQPAIGYKLNGGFAEYMAVPENVLRLGYVNKIPDDLKSEEASLSEIVACCINAQRNAVVEKGDIVLILGAGPAGIIHAHLSKLKGASKVIMSQRSRYRLENVLTTFPGLVDRAIVSSEEDLFEAVKEECGGFGPDVVFVCAPSREAQEQALKMVNNRGRVCFFGGLPADDHTVSLDANDLHYREFFISGSSSSLPETNREALELLRSKKIDGEKMITTILPLEQLTDGFALMEARKCIKVVIKL